MSKLELRPYQSQSIQCLRDGFLLNHTRQILAAPTGAGKSIILVSMIGAALEKGKRVLFLCERRILVEQFSAHLDRAGLAHGVLMAGHWRFRPYEKVQIGTAQTLERMESMPIFDIVFIDELHACLRKSIIKMMDVNPNLRIVGATATPFHRLIPKYFTNLVCVTTMQKLVNDGFLVPFRVFIAREIDTSGLKVVAGEWKKDDLEERGKRIVGDVVADYVRISLDVFGGYRKTICFSSGIEHGAELAKKFNEIGVNAVQISSGDNEDYRDEVLKDFAKADTKINVLISVSILSRGFDQSDVQHVILARPLKKSFSEHVQMVGRGARSHPEKKFCVIQDHASNWLRFKDDFDKLFENGQELNQDVDGKERKEPSKKEKDAAKCLNCGFLWTGGLVCQNCGHVKQFNSKNDVINVAGECGELLDALKPEKFTSEYKENFYAELIGYAVSKGHNPGSAWHRYREKFGVNPSMSKPDPKPPSSVVKNWIISQSIRRAKSKKEVL